MQDGDTSQVPICVLIHQVPEVHIRKPGSLSAQQVAELSGHTAQDEAQTILMQKEASLGRKLTFMIFS